MKCQLDTDGFPQKFGTRGDNPYPLEGGGKVKLKGGYFCQKRGTGSDKVLCTTGKIYLKAFIQICGLQSADWQEGA